MAVAEEVRNLSATAENAFGSRESFSQGSERVWRHKLRLRLRQRGERPRREHHRGLLLNAAYGVSLVDAIVGEERSYSKISQFCKLSINHVAKAQHMLLRFNARLVESFFAEKTVRFGRFRKAGFFCFRLVSRPPARSERFVPFVGLQNAVNWPV